MGIDTNLTVLQTGTWQLIIIATESAMKSRQSVWTLSGYKRENKYKNQQLITNTLSRTNGPY